jgi:hypothetical protein
MVAQKFAEKVQLTAPAEVELKSPFVPLFFKGGISPWDINPSLEKRKGRFFGRNDAGVIHRTSGT